MKLFKKAKKGFTLIELVVVIAVIAILAAISVVSFISINNKAKESHDNQIIDQVNLSLKADETLNGKPKTMHRALEALKEDGFLPANFGDLRGTAKDYTFAYSLKENKFVALKGGKISYPSGVGEHANHELWKIAESTTGLDDGYSYYLRGEDKKGPVSVKAGFDAGDNTGITEINYSNPSGNHNSVIRTNGGALFVNAPEDTVTHFGVADSVSIKNIHTESYHENGEVKFLEVSAGHVVLESGSDVEAFHFTATGEGSAAKFENEKGKKISVDLSQVSNERMPEFSRDPVQIDKNGTYVAEVKTDSTEYIWLFGVGVKEQMVITNSEGAIAQNGELKSGVTVGAEDGSVAEQIANPAKRNDAGQLVDANDNVIDLNNVDLTEADALDSLDIVYEELESKETIETKALVGLTGTGKERDPYKIYTYEQYVCLINLQGTTTHSSGATIYHVGKINTNSKPEKTYITFEDNIDFEWQTPFANATDRLYEYNLSIDGKGHTLTRVYGAIFNAYNENNTFRFWDYEIKNLTLDNFYGSYYGSAMGYCGAYNSTGTCTFENITVNFNSEAISWYGSMLGWTSNAPIVFKNCHVNNADVRGGSGMCIGGYVGNGQNVVFDGCTFMGKVVSDSENAGGFVGQGGANVIIRNSEIQSGTIIKNKKAGGTVQAFGSANKELSNNKFNGVLICDVKSNAKQSDIWSKADGISAGTFVINENGQISYTGEEEIARVEVRLTYAIDRLMTSVSPTRFDGYMPSIVETKEYENVSGGSNFASIDKVTNIVNVVDQNYVQSVYNGTNDATKLVESNRLGETSFYKDGTTLYVDGRGENPAFFTGCAKYVDGNLTATEITSARAVLVIYAFDANNNELGVNTLTFQFSLN